MPTAQAFWLARQPILDRDANTVAYELLFRSADSDAVRVTDHRQATSSVINHAFNELGLATVLGETRAFVNFDADLLMSDVVELLPPDRTVIELLETVVFTPLVVERCHALRKRGFAFALDDVVRIETFHSALAELIDIVKIDVMRSSGDALCALVANARAAGRVTLLAEKVDTRVRADACLELGFDLFQGFFFARPTLMAGRRADPSRQVLLRLLEQTIGDCETAEIEETLKQAPELSYKLMRLVNSVSMGLRSPIHSLAHAVTILGRRQLQRWLQLLLFAQPGAGRFPSPLLEMAALRGKLMELLAARGAANDRRLQDHAFMAGILSLLDALLELPMTEVIASLNLPDDVRGALLARDGELGHLLRVIEALEQANDAEVSALLSDGAPCSTAELAEIQIAALAWSAALAQAQEPKPGSERRSAAARASAH